MQLRRKSGLVGCATALDGYAQVQQYERVLSTATTRSFLDLLGEANREDRNGWNLVTIHEELSSFDSSIGREFAFEGDVSEVLPWWEMFKGDE